jgi:hypothetical protein
LLLLSDRKDFQREHRVPSMLRMSGRGQSRLGFAENAERRAKFALGYLVILCVMLILIAGILISVG